MTFQSTNNIYGLPQPLTRLFPAPVVLGRSPTIADFKYPIGQEWINDSNGTAYILVNITANSGTWLQFGGSSGLVTLEGDSGGIINPITGNISLLGTANEITTIGSASTITFSIPSTFITPGTIASVGSITAGTSITSTSGNMTATNGNLVLGSAANKLISTSVGSGATAGANSIGQVTLIAGTITVTTTAVTSSSIIILSRASVGSTGAAATGLISQGTIVNGTSFVINSLSLSNASNVVTTDVSVVNWMIIN